jgi:hypothetical protein
LPAADALKRRRILTGPSFLPDGERHSGCLLIADKPMQNPAFPWVDAAAYTSLLQNFFS